MRSETGCPPGSNPQEHMMPSSPPSRRPSFWRRYLASPLRVRLSTPFIPDPLRESAMKQHPLAAFIEARLAEDERTLLEAGDTDPAPNHQLYVLDDDYRHNQVVIPTSRARRELEAKRKLLAAHAHIPGDGINFTFAERDRAEETLCLLALPYSDHPEYAALVGQTDTR
ncbi:DUF6221 family protein [Streptosporangium sp. NPDC001559]|uniref:DUF6221 family protein n=1 Tax=Streptosporangium sp. NPDC001559 TaxID=3366187 RepID=UPI0036DFBE1B